MVAVRQRRLVVLKALEQRERLYQTLRPEVRALLQRQQVTEQRGRLLEGLVGQGSALAQLLATVADVLPRTVWLTKAECSKDAAGMDALLEGRARSFQDVTELLERLKRADGVTGVKPLATNVVSDQETGKESIAFSVRVELHPLVEPAAAAPPQKNVKKKGKGP
jgi:Tfp pilus assembly protein PilN